MDAPRHLYGLAARFQQDLYQRVQHTPSQLPAVADMLAKLSDDYSCPVEIRVMSRESGVGSLQAVADWDGTLCVRENVLTREQVQVFARRRISYSGVEQDVYDILDAVYMSRVGKMRVAAEVIVTLKQAK